MPNQKWEYKVIGHDSSGPIKGVDEELGITLDDWGNDGWEVISMFGTPGGIRQIVLKRPKN